MPVNVDALITRAINTGDQLLAGAESTLNDAATYARSGAQINERAFSYNFNPITVALDYNPEKFLDYYVSPVKAFTKPTFADILIPEVFTIGDAPDIDTSGLFLASRPNSNIGEFTEQSPTPDIDGLITQADNLERPVIHYHETPTLTPITVKPMPTVSLPSLDISTPIDNAPAIPDLKTEYLSRYETMLPSMQKFIDDGVRAWRDEYAPDLTAITEKLIQELSDGMDTGTALPATYDDALRNKARAEINATNTATEQAVISAGEKRGFYVPEGAVTGAISRAKMQAGASIATSNTDIYIKRKEQEIQHIQFCMTLAASLQNNLLQLMISYAGILGDTNKTAMSFAKAIADIMAEMQRLAYERIRLQIDIVNTEIRLYEARLKASLAVLDQYRLELEANRLIRDLDKSAIDIWTEQWNVELKQMELYIKELDSIYSRGNLYKLEFETFNQSLNAYNAKLGAKELEIKIYEAANRGDSEKLKGLMADLDIYSTKLKTIETRNNIQIATANNINASNRNLVDIYGAELRSFSTEVDAESKRFDSSVRGYASRLETFKSINATKIQQLEAQLSSARMEFTAADTVYKSNNIIAMKNADLFMETAKNVLATAVTIGTTNAGLAQGMLAAQNSMITATDV
jgi:hypothetical protein